VIGPLNLSVGTSSIVCSDCKVMIKSSLK